MNTGIQDVYNLAWKLAFVYQKKARLSLLETYNNERLPVAQSLVNTIDRIFNILISTNPLAIFTRFHIIPRAIGFVTHHKILGPKAFKTLSQIGIHYKMSESDIEHQKEFSNTSPLPGDRLAYVSTIQDSITLTKMHLIVFSQSEYTISSLQEIIRPYEKIIQITQMPLNKSTQEIYEVFGIKFPSFYLVRPDMYIAYRGLIENTNSLVQYLKKNFL
jgi:hypothetical protein